MEQNAAREGQQRKAVRLTAQEAFIVKYLERRVRAEVLPVSMNSRELSIAFTEVMNALDAYRKKLSEYRGSLTTTLQDAESMVRIIEQEWKKELAFCEEIADEVGEAIDR